MLLGDATAWCVQLARGIDSQDGTDHLYRRRTRPTRLCDPGALHHPLFGDSRQICDPETRSERWDDLYRRTDTDPVQLDERAAAPDA